MEESKTTRYTDPLTGDTLPKIEYYTRQLQVFVRTPWFILFFNAITIAAMLLGHGDTWNYFASWLAIMIEWLVGTFMFGQTGRDAVVNRQTRANSMRIETLEQQNAQELHALHTIATRLEELSELLVKDITAIEDDLEHPIDVEIDEREPEAPEREDEHGNQA